MYPNTTSLYSATVVDNTTYCRNDDDIIVVDFDGDEPDANGALPQCHVPARFVTLIPREYPASQPPSSNKSTKASKAKSTKTTLSQPELDASHNASIAAAASAALGLDPLVDDLDLDDGLFDDLGFDLG